MYSSDEEKLLTERELEVLDCLHNGYSNPKIADYLCITVSTVKAHLSSIFRKLGAENRVDTLLILLGEKEISNNFVKEQIASLTNKIVHK